MSGKALQGLVDEILNFTGLGTVLSGLITGSITALMGGAFLFWVHDEYKEKTENQQQ